MKKMAPDNLTRSERVVEVSSERMTSAVISLTFLNAPVFVDLVGFDDPPLVLFLLGAMVVVGRDLCGEKVDLEGKFLEGGPELRCDADICADINANIRK
jgi:hypothetical protein